MDPTTLTPAAKPTPVVICFCGARSETTHKPGCTPTVKVAFKRAAFARSSRRARANIAAAITIPGVRGCPGFVEIRLMWSLDLKTAMNASTSIPDAAAYLGADDDAPGAAVESLLCHGELVLVDGDHVAPAARGTTTPGRVADLSAERLGARARTAAATVAQAGISLRDDEVLAFEAAHLGCAHLGHVEVLEATARRAARFLVSAPVVRLV